MNWVSTANWCLSAVFIVLLIYTFRQVQLMWMVQKTYRTGMEEHALYKQMAEPLIESQKYMIVQLAAVLTKAFEGSVKTYEDGTKAAIIPLPDGLVTFMISEPFWPLFENLPTTELDIAVQTQEEVVLRLIKYMSN